MKFTSPIISAGSGSIAGCTVSRNRGGMYMRNRAVPVNPNSASQQVMRGALATLVANWTSILDTDQRAAWNTWALNTPQTDALGSTYKMSGQNAYIKMNSLRILAGVAIINDAPATYAGAALSQPTAIVIQEATQLISFAFTNTDAWATAVGGHLMVFSSRPQNPSKSFFAGPFRYAGRVNGAGPDHRRPSRPRFRQRSIKRFVRLSPIQTHASRRHGQ
jgi:hypothetical protein